MVYTVNRASADVLAVLARQPRVAGDRALSSRAVGTSRATEAKGYFETEWGTPASWRDVILQGPHLHVGVPFYKSPNETMLHNQDWSPVDLEALASGRDPGDVVQAARDRGGYDAGVHALG